MLALHALRISTVRGSARVIPEVTLRLYDGPSGGLTRALNETAAR
jgi:hypothetical protein